MQDGARVVDRNRTGGGSGGAALAGGISSTPNAAIASGYGRDDKTEVMNTAMSGGSSLREEIKELVQDD